jgi:hypothetical protein
VTWGGFPRLETLSSRLKSTIFQCSSIPLSIDVAAAIYEICLNYYGKPNQILEVLVNQGESRIFQAQVPLFAYSIVRMVEILGNHHLHAG